MGRKIQRKQCSLALVLPGDFPDVLRVCGEHLVPLSTDSEQPHLPQMGLGKAAKEQVRSFGSLLAWSSTFRADPGSLAAQARRKPKARGQSCPSCPWKPLWATAIREAEVNSQIPNE